MSHIYPIKTDRAPAAIGPYSQAIRVGRTVYLSGQLGLVTGDKAIVPGGAAVELMQIFENIAAIAKTAGGSLQHVVKLTVYLLNFTEDFPVVNDIMEKTFKAPYPARTTIGAALLPKGALVEVDAVLSLER